MPKLSLIVAATIAAIILAPRNPAAGSPYHGDLSAFQAEAAAPH